MYVATGYSDATLMKDVRFKLGIALREASAPCRQPVSQSVITNPYHGA